MPNKTDAAAFAEELLVDKDLAQQWGTQLQTITKKVDQRFPHDDAHALETYITEDMNNWLTQKGYDFTLEDLAKAQSALPDYQLCFWAGTYQTLLSTPTSQAQPGDSSQSKSGPELTVGLQEGSDGSLVATVQFGKTTITPSEAFQNATLQWGDSSAPTGDHGEISFAFEQGESANSSLIKVFYGQVTQNNVTSDIAGSSKVEAGSRSPSPSTRPGSALDKAMVIVNYALTLFFLGDMLIKTAGWLYKAGGKISNALRTKLRARARGLLDSSQECSDSLDEQSRQIDDMGNEDFKTEGSGISTTQQGETTSSTETLPDEGEQELEDQALRNVGDDTYDTFDETSGTIATPGQEGEDLNRSFNDNLYTGGEETPSASSVTTRMNEASDTMQSVEEDASDETSLSQCAGDLEEEAASAETALADSPVMGDLLGGLGGFLGLAGLFMSGETLAMEKKIEREERQIEQDEAKILNVEKQIQQQITSMAQTLTANQQKLSEQLSSTLSTLEEDLNSLKRLVDWDYALGSVHPYATFLENTVIPAYQNRGADSSKDRQLAQIFLQPEADSAKSQLDLFYSGVMGEDFNDARSLLTLFFCNPTLDGENYQDRLKLSKSWVAKIDYLLLNGMHALLWAARITKSSISGSLLTAYTQKMRHFYQRVYALEPALYEYLPARLTNYRQVEEGVLQLDFARSGGNDTVTITNSDSAGVSIAFLKIYTNLNIGDAWGSLRWAGNVNVSTQANELEDSYVHILAYDPPLSLPAGSSSVLSYSFSGKGIVTKGPLQSVPLFPTVQIGISTGQGGHSLQLLPMKSITIKPPNYTSNLQITLGNEAPTSGLPQGKRIVGYYPNYGMYAAQTTAIDIPFEKINQLSYAFMQYNEAGEINSSDAWADAFNLPIVQQFRQVNPSLRVELLLGGWPSASFDSRSTFHKLAASASARQAFATNAAKILRFLRLDGLGIDWEYPETSDAENYVAMLQALRSEFDKYGFRLSIAAPAGIDKINNLTLDQWSRIADCVDEINIMTYDYFTGGERCSDFHAPMQLGPDDPNASGPTAGYCVESTLNTYLQMRCFSRGQLALGIPMYGRAVNLATTDNIGINQPINTQSPVPWGEFDDQKGTPTGVFSYRFIVACKTEWDSAPTTFPPDGTRPRLPKDMIYTAPDLSLYQKSSQDDQQPGYYGAMPWGYSKSTPMFISFDDDQSAAAKADWALQNDLGGVMLWDLTGDVHIDNESSILATVFKKMTSSQSSD